jgi:hypothetical protein
MSVAQSDTRAGPRAGPAPGDAIDLPASAALRHPSYARCRARRRGVTQRAALAALAALDALFASLQHRAFRGEL